MRELMIAMGLISLAIGCGSGVFAPNEGEWEIGEFVADDGCGPDMSLSDTGAASETVELVMDKDGKGFTIFEEDGEGPHCLLSGKNFDCDLPDDSDSETSLDEWGLDATLYFELATITGAFSSQTAGKVSSETDISCEGDNCDVVEPDFGGSLPCTLVNEASLTAL